MIVVVESEQGGGDDEVEEMRFVIENDPTDADEENYKMKEKRSMRSNRKLWLKLKNLVVKINLNG